MKFPYFRFPQEGYSPSFSSTILRPIIQVTLSKGEYSIEYAALIDTGADFCIFDAEIGELLGIDIQSGKQMLFGGVQDTRPGEAFLHSIDLIVGKSKNTIIVGFSYDIAKHGYGILAQKGFGT